MKILYISTVNFTEEDMNTDGITKKILGQIDAMMSLGMDVDYVGRSEGAVFLYSKGNRRKLCESRNSSYLDNIHISKVVLALLDDEKWDAIYVRYCGLDWNSLKLFEACRKKKIKVYLELPTYPYRKEMFGRITTLLRYLISSIYKPKLKKFLTAIITYTDYDEIYGVPTIRIENGININSVPVYRNDDLSELNLIIVGRMQKWHGFDRLLVGLGKYYESEEGKKKVFLDIVGDGSVLDKYKEIVKKLNMEDYVTFHGKKSGEELDRIFKKAHVSINSLGLHRIGLKDASTIKAKEYVARGLPIVFATSEVLLSENLFFCHRVPSDESLVDIEQILIFYENVLTYDDYQKAIRKYAEENMTWEKQMKKVFNNNVR